MSDGTRSALAPRYRAQLIISAVSASLAALYACKKEEEVQYPPTSQSYVASDAGGSWSAPPDAGPSPTEAGAELDSGSMSDGALPSDAGTALNPLSLQLYEQRLSELAKKSARGMKPVADAFGGAVAMGGQVESGFMMEPNKCYSVLAVGGTGVSEVDVQIVAKPTMVALPAPILAHDMTQGPEAAISPCWKNAFGVAFPATVLVKATQGQGEVAGRVYVK